MKHFEGDACGRMKERGKGRGRGGEGGEHGGGRIFGHGEMRLVILLLLSENHAHGYELIKEIAERLSGAYTPSPGLIYPTLNLLEELGYIASEAVDDAKRAYAITDLGREFLKLNQHKIDHIVERMAHVAAHQRRANSPELSEAMDKLKAALQKKTGEKDFSKQKASALASVITQAANAIAQL